MLLPFKVLIIGVGLISILGCIQIYLEDKNQK